MSDPPRISVFITSYNQKDLLVEAIDSVLAQTLQPLEILICDDASTDGSREVISQYATQYSDLIRPYLHPKNLGIAPNKAFAQRECRGDWMTYLDGDDRYLPAKLANEWAALQAAPEARIAFSNIYTINDAGDRIRQWAEDSDVIPTGNIFAEVFSRTFPGRIVFRNELIARECFESVGYYDESRKTHEDWDLKIRMTQRYLACYAPQPGVEYRRHEQGVSNQMREAMLLREVRSVYQNNLPLLKDSTPEQRDGIIAAVEGQLRKRVARLVYLESRNGSKSAALRLMWEFRQWLTRAAVLKVMLPARWHGWVERRYEQAENA